jgi:hypothetical protein
MRGFVRSNGLGLFFGGIFLLTLIGQALVGHADFNHQQLSHHDDPISLSRYVFSSSFGSDVMENWQSEFLQFTLYILATVWSDEEQKVGEHATRSSPRWARLGGWRTRIYSNSLVIVMTAIWLASWGVQSVAGHVAYNAEQFDHQLAAISWLGYIGTSDFWNRTLQNWQSEFLAVGSMAVFSIYLRQRGSPESKPVGAPHHATGVEG